MSQAKSRERKGATTLLLVRHAETQCNVEVRLSGWTDSELTERGLEQTRRLAEHFKRAHEGSVAIYASPLARARAAAEAICSLTGHELVLDPDLREMHFGELEGRRLTELQLERAELLAQNEELDGAFSWPGGESREGFAVRVRRSIDRIAARHAGEIVAVITHGGVISTFLACLHGEGAGAWRNWLVKNASLTEVRWDPVLGSGVMLRQSDDAHLGELRAEKAWGER
jgi:2,3-bisphosphoglycerate-dependent phosphoglycerate mutase